MKTVIGIDLLERHQSAVRLLARLNFAGNEWHLVHVVEPIAAGPLEDPASVELSDSLIRMRMDDAKALLKDIVEMYPDQTMVERPIQVGYPAAEIMRIGDEIRADLLAGGSTVHGAFQAFALGSVCRSLAIGASQSVLIGKGEVTKEGPINAVIATDHSPYMKRCLKEFIKMRPQGIRKVTLLTAARDRDGMPLMELPMSEWVPENERQLVDTLGGMNCEACDDLWAAGIKCDSMVLDTDPNSAIREAMNKTEADLLVVGAQGHGFFDRVFIGSTSLHNVVAEEYPMLLLRVPGK